MPDLLHMLIDYDPAMMKIIAGKWGLGLENPSQLDAAKELTSLMLAPGEVNRIINSLPKCRMRLPFQHLHCRGETPMAGFLAEAWSNTGNGYCPART